MIKRIIPLLLIDRNKRLIKTVKFNKRTYVGDPFNVIRLFNEREVDEICLLDIDATNDGRSPDFDFLEKFAGECFMPLSYGGGIKTIEDCDHLNKLGIEKFVLKSYALNKSLIDGLKSKFGSQALIGCLDYNVGNSIGLEDQETATDEGFSVVGTAKQFEEQGFGEIILQNRDYDGCRTGYDLETIQQVSSEIGIPLIALGGAGEYEHLRPALERGASAVASGSAFTFIGKLRAVLINYPDYETQKKIAGGF